MQANGFDRQWKHLLYALVAVSLPDVHILETQREAQMTAVVEADDQLDARVAGNAHRKRKRT